jgi:hypothetical protein
MASDLAPVPRCDHQVACIWYVMGDEVCFLVRVRWNCSLEVNEVTEIATGRDLGHYTTTSIGELAGLGRWDPRRELGCGSEGGVA